MRMAVVQIWIGKCGFALTAVHAQQNCRGKTVGEATVVDRGDATAQARSRMAAAASSATQRIPQVDCERTNSGDMAAREALALRLQSGSARKNDTRA